MESLQPVRGTRDLFFREAELYTYIAELSRNMARVYGYNEAYLPILEYTEVFARTLGETSDVVHKQMYTFTDKAGRSLTLRPEFTAGIARSIISNGLYSKLPLRLFSTGPVFRYENPQKGRYRQFNQVNFEAIGYHNPVVDAEMISLARAILDNLKLADCTLELNSLGDVSSRAKYTAALCKHLTKYESELSEDSQMRLKKNPLRILDSKSENDQKLLKDAPILQNYLSKESKIFFGELLKNLDALGISYVINDKIVRGLDYYTDTVFEFTTNKLGAQGTVLAGGRYDGLFKVMGDKDIPAVGFAGGVDRLMALCEENYVDATKWFVNVLLLDSQYAPYGLQVASILRQENIPTILEESRDVGKSIKKALENKAKFIVFIGENEVSKNIVKLKNLDTRAEQEVPVDQLVMVVKSASTNAGLKDYGID